MHPIRTAAPVALLAFAACGEAENPIDPNCTVEAQNTWLQGVMSRWYLEPDQLRDVRPADYPSPNAFLNALVDGVDLSPDVPDDNGADRFSRVLTVAQETSLVFNTVTGFGLVMEVTTDTPSLIRIVDAYGVFSAEPATPASQAGLDRGDVIETINGQPVSEAFDLVRLEGRKFNFGFPAGDSAELGVRKRDTGALETVTLVSEELSPVSVPLHLVFERNDEAIGYVLFREFDLGAVEGLRRAFATFAGRGVTKVIIDERYNPGGFVLVVDFLANLLRGNDLSGQLFRGEVWNARQNRLNEEVRFQTPQCPEALASSPYEAFDCQGSVRGLTGLDRLVFITTGNSASSAEVILNGMLPHVDVGVVGDRTFGKPVGSIPLPGAETGEASMCGLVARPITFRNVNAEGQANYFDGFVPDCPAPDDTGRPFGDEREASLATALFYAAEGQCPPSFAPSTSAPPTSAPPTSAPPTSGAEPTPLVGPDNSVRRLLDENRN